MSKRNRQAGHDFERKHAQLFRDKLGLLDVATSRECNLTRDHAGIDLSHKDEFKHGRLFLDVQLKKATSVSLPAVLERIEYDKDRMRVVIWCRTEGKNQSTGRRIIASTGEYAFLGIEDFYKLLECYVKHNNLTLCYHKDMFTQPIPDSMPKPPQDGSNY